MSVTIFHNALFFFLGKLLSSWLHVLHNAAIPLLLNYILTGLSDTNVYVVNESPISTVCVCVCAFLLCHDPHTWPFCAIISPSLPHFFNPKYLQGPDKMPSALEKARNHPQNSNCAIHLAFFFVKALKHKKACLVNEGHPRQINSN